MMVAILGAVGGHPRICVRGRPPEERRAREGVGGKVEQAVRNSAFVEAPRGESLAGGRPLFPAGTVAIVKRSGYAGASP